MPKGSRLKDAIAALRMVAARLGIGRRKPLSVHAAARAHRISPLEVRLVEARLLRAAEDAVAPAGPGGA